MLASEMLNTVYAYLLEQPREKGMRKLEWAAFRSAITLLGFTVCCILQGSLHALRDDIDNRVEYALWQQRQAHEASLQQLTQQHAQELQLAVSL